MLTILQASGAAAKGSSGSTWSFIIMIAVIFLIMWLLMIRPQQKKQKELQKFRDSLKKGDKIVTIGGIYGVIESIDDKSALIQVDNNVKIRVDKSALQKDFSETQS
ncbi:MAG: preprotein translocase subunit YajC [Bacteroidales bacterium]|jgi:preprotein translocase subunit YajC|nr:preprotein translocase subunit YajC [Bacteroidales bacterium]MCI2122270.1 preprotein translocase subunit YajC [Bacteroidales bacterium]MCI2144651.1 preprotein translocase subunit YajC [Bacteroidales bacterium]